MFEFLKRNGEDEGILQKKGLWILLLAAVGLVLLLFGGRISAKEEPMPDVLYSPKEDELVLYREHIEERIQSLCQSVSGVGKVQVAVTLSGGYEAVYATEIKDGNEEYVILGSGSSATALLLSKETPAVIGVGIVCNGGADTRVKSELTALVSAAFDVPTNRIYISAP